MNIRTLLNKKLLGVILLTVFTTLTFKIGCSKVVNNTDDNAIDVNELIYQAFVIIANIESNYSQHKYDNVYKSHGIVQIRKICVKDVNRVYNTKYNIKDTYDKHKSFAIFNLYVKKYCKNLSIYEIGRVWNGGPKGKLSKSYRHKIDKYKGDYLQDIGITKQPLIINFLHLML